MSKPLPNKIRAIGVLLHPTALPSDSGCGTFGEPARIWVRELAKNGICVWQMLPLGPSDSSGSPYSSPSSFSLNPYFLDTNDLVDEGFLSSSFKVESVDENTNLNYSLNLEALNKSSKRIGFYLREHWSYQSPRIHKAFDKWCSKQFWLEDHVTFTELRYQYDLLPWWEWPNKFSSNDNLAIRNWKKNYRKELLEHRLVQWHLYLQWAKLKDYANKLGVYLFGDIPFYVSRDSSDVWSNRGLFSILSSGELKMQSGVPPDYFSSTGQLWGTPVYDWRIHRLTFFRWWRKRISQHLKQFDLLRLDHFRALESYWGVPGEDLTAENGKWIKSPGSDLLKALKEDLGGKLPIVAEDLGIITKEVESLRNDFGLMGMKVLQFAFDGNEDNPYLPENIIGNNWIIYTGTHDNPTTLSWWQNLDPETKKRLEVRFDNSDDSPVWKLLDMGLSSDSKLVIAPLQDLLCLGDSATFNKPGTIGNNWRWRLKEFDDYLFKSLYSYGERSRFWGRSDVFLSELINSESSL